MDNSEKTLISSVHGEERAKSSSGMEKIKKKGNLDEQNTEPLNLTDSEEEEEDSEDESEVEDLQYFKSTVGKESWTNISGRMKNLDLNPVLGKAEGMQLPHMMDLAQTIKKAARDPLPIISHTQTDVRTVHASRLKAPKEEINLDEQVTDPPSLTGTEEEEDPEDDIQSDSSRLLTGILKATITGKARTNVNRDSPDEDKKEIKIKEEHTFRPSGKLLGKETKNPFRATNNGPPKERDAKKASETKKERSNEEPKSTDITMPGPIISGKEEKKRIEEGIPGKESNCNKETKAVAVNKPTSPEDETPIQSRKGGSNIHYDHSANLFADKKLDDKSKIVLGCNEIQEIYFPPVNEPAAVL